MNDRDEFIEPHQRGNATRQDADAVVTRSEEELRITTHRRATQIARLTRFVETETVTRTVEVRREQVRIDYEPVASGDDAGRAATGSGVGNEQWMILYDEEVVLTTRRVPRERVRLRTRAVIEDHEISEELRTEKIEVSDRDGDRGR